MPGLADFVFATPWVLWALLVLPVIWWLLKVTPPAPKRVRFPAVRLLFDLRREEETPAKTPPWLILLRLLAAALLITALAHPLIDPGARIEGDGPLVLVVDDDWAAARRWERREATLADLLDKAARADRPVVVATTAPTASNGAAPAPRLMRAEEARDLVQALQPKPWAVDRAAARAALDGLAIDGADVRWLSNGIGDEDVAGLVATLQGFGPLQVMTDPDLDRARVLVPPLAEPGGLRLRVVRTVASGAEALWLRAVGGESDPLFREQVTFAPDQHSAEVEIDAPVELRNRIVRIEIEGERTAAAVVLLDERWRRRPVGLVSGSSIEADQPLLSELYYLERALTPFSEVRKGDLNDLLQRPLAVLVLADVAKIQGNEHAALGGWLDGGGVLVRFAGPRLAEGVDDLVPVRLRGGGRALGGVLSWSEPAALAQFDADSPFAGLTAAKDVRVRHQVLAEPSLDLAAKTWARLADGTPLVTAERRGQGWLVLVHTTANTAWSNLVLSGLFVEMLQRLAGLSQGVAGDQDEGSLAPLKTLDGFGRLMEPPATSRPLPADTFAKAVAGPQHPPGWYGAGGARQALNLSASIAEPRPIGDLPAGVERAAYGAAGETDLKPWLLVAAVLLALIDLLVGLALRGLLGYGAARSAIAALLLALAGFGATPVLAQDAGGNDAFTLEATLEMRLAYVRTGNANIDEVSRAGLQGLSTTLQARTSIEPADPMGIDVEADELIFFPLIYWPVATEQERLSQRALVKIDDYLKTGGIILFDTRDQNAGLSRQVGGLGPGAQHLRKLLKDLNIPPLQPVPPEHVLTRSFYLMQDFPGRWTGGQVWVERHEGGVNDGVSSLIIGSHDWAAAWAIDDRRRPLFAAVPGGERQREHAFRFGVNLVMYAMTGNYKADQVHLPAILERLGQ